MTMYRAASGALVFGAGTVQWAWGLDSDHDGDSQSPPTIRSCSRRPLTCWPRWARQPPTLMSGLVPGTESTDTTPPTSTITSPSAGATFPNDSTVTMRVRDHRHGRRCRRRRRGVARRGVELASRHHDVSRPRHCQLDLHVVRDGSGHGEDPVAGNE